MRACAREPAMSSAARRLSNSMETLISAMISAGPPANRPPHILLVPMNLDLLKRPIVLAAAAAVILIGALVLYVMPSGPVHAPPSLAALIPAKPAVAVPDTAFTDGMGKRHLISEFKGHYVLLNMWATWCGPCVK